MVTSTGSSAPGRPDGTVSWPTLDPHHEAALCEAVDYIIGRFAPHGIVACGSIVRGQHDRSSDFDLYVLHDEPWRQRVQRSFLGVPAEIFVNPTFQVQRYLDEERRDGRPITAHMLGTGVVIIDRSGHATRVRDLAAADLRRPPTLSPEDLVARRYALATPLEDVVDIADRDPDTAMLLLGPVVLGMLRHAFLSTGHHLPRPKETLAALAEINPALHQAAIDFCRARDLEHALELALIIADLTIEAHGFFDWESPRDPVQPDPTAR